ncbi:MAG: phosphoenolpyruvate carboxykinase (GTP), partial [Alphaproteobacteria bacterium]|nr:phosphoenolpyruvate carboxykinase (GTP) [Alphaproteobacteria bacterium]
NMRVLKWIVERVQGRARAVESPLGHMPQHADLTWKGLDYDDEHFHHLMEVDRAGAMADAEDQAELFGRFKDHLPSALETQRQAQIERLNTAPELWELPWRDAD